MVKFSSSIYSIRLVSTKEKISWSDVIDCYTKSNQIVRIFDWKKKFSKATNDVNMFSSRKFLFGLIFFLSGNEPLQLNYTIKTRKKKWSLTNSSSMSKQAGFLLSWFAVL